MGEEEEEEEANKHIWRQKEMISLVNFAYHPPFSSWHFICHRWREMVCPNDLCLENSTCKATGWRDMRVCESLSDAEGKGVGCSFAAPQCTSVFW